MPPQIVWVGSFQSTQWKTNEAKFADALERQGAEVFRLDPPWYGLEAQLDDADLVVFSKCGTFSRPRLAEIAARRGRPRLVQVLFDLMDYPERRFRGMPWPTRNRLRWWIPLAPHFDLVLLKERGLFDVYERAGVRCFYLDEAAEPIGPEAERLAYRETDDVAFIGGPSRLRLRRFTDLAAGWQAAAYGPGWERWRWRHQHINSRPPVHGIDFVAAVRSSKVIWSENRRHDVAGYWSDRVYRVLASGGVFLTRYTPGLEAVFENGRHLVWYETLDEAKNLLSQLVADVEWRDRLRAEGTALVEARHTYDHRARELLEITARIRVRND